MKTIRIILADDHTLMREGLSSLLRVQPDIEVVAEAENGRAAVQLTQRLLPDVVIMDITMPDLNGIDATRQITAKLPGTKIIALSMHSDRQFVLEMLRAGASGYVLKDSAIEELANVIRLVHQNEIYVSPKVSGQILTEYSVVLQARQGWRSAELTDREREVLQLLSEGKSTKQIASDLHVSAKTIETHRQHIMDKLQLYTVAELTKYAIRERRLSKSCPVLAAMRPMPGRAFPAWCFSI